MRTNLKAILAAMGAAALVATPAMAKTYHAHGFAAANGAYGAYYNVPSNEGGPYSPNAPTPAHGQSHDFQNGPRGE